MLAATSLLANPVVWIFTIMWACIAWARAQNFTRRTGRNAWGMAPWLWGLLGFVLGLVGAILALIATRRSAVEAALGYGSRYQAGYGAPPHGGPSGYGTPPSGYPSGYGTPPPGEPSWGGGSVPPPPAALPPADASPTAPPPGWYPRPGNPYQQAYWDGSAWGPCIRWDGTAWVPDEPGSPSPTEPSGS